jgi:site-specific recombinase XerD
MAGTELVEAGVAIDVVQALLGHRRLASTQIYAHASDRRVREAVEAVEALSRRRRGQHPEEAR